MSKNDLKYFFSQKFYMPKFTLGGFCVVFGVAEHRTIKRCEIFFKKNFFLKENSDFFTNYEKTAWRKFQKCPEVALQLGFRGSTVRLKQKSARYKISMGSDLKSKIDFLVKNDIFTKKRKVENTQFLTLLKVIFRYLDLLKMCFRPSNRV